MTVLRTRGFMGLFWSTDTASRFSGLDQTPLLIIQARAASWVNPCFSERMQWSHLACSLWVLLGNASVHLKSQLSIRVLQLARVRAVDDCGGRRAVCASHAAGAQTRKLIHCSGQTRKNLDPFACPSGPVFYSQSKKRLEDWLVLYLQGGLLTILSSSRSFYKWQPPHHKPCLDSRKTVGLKDLQQAVWTRRLFGWERNTFVSDQAWPSA